MIDALVQAIAILYCVNRRSPAAGVLEIVNTMATFCSIGAK